jgi:para-aminobenzoate synthetase component 1
MGSMTGAPKIRAMEVIDSVECFSRGWYSGSIGLITPNGDFDLNVVIRSLFYDADCKTLTYPVGSAITIQANAKDEYEECLIKLNSLLNLLREES